MSSLREGTRVCAERVLRIGAGKPPRREQIEGESGQHREPDCEQQRPTLHTDLIGSRQVDRGRGREELQESKRERDPEGGPR